MILGHQRRCWLLILIGVLLLVFVCIRPSPAILLLPALKLYQHEVLFRLFNIINAKGSQKVIGKQSCRFLINIISILR
jgi:hypothetical protein